MLMKSQGTESDGIAYDIITGPKTNLTIIRYCIPYKTPRLPFAKKVEHIQGNRIKADDSDEPRLLEYITEG